MNRGPNGGLPSRQTFVLRSSRCGLTLRRILMGKRTLIDHPYREFIRSHPCVVAVETGSAADCAFRMCACHFRHSGMGGKDVPDRGNLWPGCHHHHMESHSSGIKTFQRKYQLDLLGVCVRLLDEFLHGANFINGPYGAEVAHL